MGKKIAWKRALRRDRGDAFVPDTATGGLIQADDAESLAEEFIAGVTSADFVLEDARNELSVDEVGGPYLTVDATTDRDDVDAEPS